MSGNVVGTGDNSEKVDMVPDFQFNNMVEGADIKNYAKNSLINRLVNSD